MREKVESCRLRVRKTALQLNLLNAIIKPKFALGIEVDLPAPTGRKPFCEERTKRLQRKARPVGKRLEKVEGCMFKEQTC